VSSPGPGSVSGAGSVGRYRGRSGRFGWPQPPSSFWSAAPPLRLSASLAASRRRRAAVHFSSTSVHVQLQSAVQFKFSRSLSQSPVDDSLEALASCLRARSLG